MVNWFAIGLMAISGAMMALMDLNAHGKKGKDPADTWPDKWRVDKSGNPIPNNKRPLKYLKLYRPKFKEKFPYSSTFLVWLVDPWHRHKKIFMATLFGAIALRPEITMWGALDALILNVILLIAFNLVYHWRQIKPNA